MTTPNKTGTSQRELSDFVSYLLDGSGVENVVDLQRLRRELEDEASNATATTASFGHRAASRSVSPAPSTLTRHRSALLASPADASTPVQRKPTSRSSSALFDHPARNASQSDQAAGNARGQKSESFRESEQRDSGRKESTRPMQSSISASQLQQQVHHQPSRQASLQLLDEFIKQSVPTTADSEKLEVSENANAMNSMHHYPVSPIAPSSQHRKMSVGSISKLDAVPERRVAEEFLGNEDDESLMRIYKEYPAAASGRQSTYATDIGNDSRRERESTRDSVKVIQQRNSQRESRAGDRIQDWVAGNSQRHSVTQEDDAAEQVFQSVCRRLDIMGLPSLNSSLFSSTATSSLPTTISAQKHHIARLLNTLLDELSRKTEDTQKLSERITNSLEERQKLEDQVQQYADDLKRGESKDWKIIQEQQDSLTSASSQIAVLRSDLVSAKHDAQDAKVIQAQLKKRLAQAEIEKLEAVSELETFKAKVEKTRKQNEQNFTRIAETVNRYKTDVSKSGIDRLTLEVIEVYESKLADLRKEVSELRTFKLASAGNQTQQTEPTDLTGSFSRANRVVDFDQEIHSLERSGFPQTRHFARQGPDGENYTVSVDSTKMIHAQRLLEEKVRDLEDRLESAQKKGTEAIQQSELLRLQLLESKRPGWVEQARSDINAGLSTRELIRRDKQSWKMKLYQIDAMNLDECRTMLKSVCIHLAITDVPSLLPGLAAIDSTLRLLPQLQSFITTIDTLVHKHYTHLFETNSGGETNSKNGSTLQSLASSTKKLNELTEIVAMWAHASQEVESLRDFRQTMHRALGVRESGGSLAGCLEIVQRLKERVSTSNANSVGGGANSSNIRDNSGEEVGLQRFVDELYHLFGVRDGVGSLQVLLDVCRGLKIAVEEGGNRSVPGLSGEEKVKLKELEAFGYQVHSVLGIRVSKGSLDSCLQQLDDLIQRLDSGGADAAVDGFLESVHRVLGVNRKPGSLDDCLAVIRILVEKGRTSPQVQKQNYELYSRLVEHFMELFEIKTVDEVNSAVNELYVMFSERNASIARLRNCIRNTNLVNGPLDTPARVLAEAADLIEAQANKKSSFRTSVSGYRQSQSNVQSQPPQSQPTQNQDMSLDPFNDEDFMQAVTDAANFQNETLDHNPIPLDWAVDDDDIGPHQQQQQELDQARSRGSVGAGAPNRSWQEISSSIRNLTSGLGGVA